MKLARLILCSTFILCAVFVAFGQKPLAETFSAPAIDGQNIDLEELKGKVVLITFWSTTCAICEAEIPQLNRMAGLYKGKDVVFLALTTENPTRVESFLKMRPFDFNVIPSSFGVLLKYAERDRAGRVIMGYPAYFLVNQNGEIEMKDSGWDKVAKINTRIDGLLKNAPEKQK